MKFLAGLLGFLSKVMSALPALLAYIEGKRVGRMASDNDKMSAERDRLDAAKKAKEEADASDTPDPYIRD